MPAIYIQNKPLLLVDKVEGIAEELLHRPDTVYIDELSSASVRTMLQQLEKDDVYAGIFLHNDLEQLTDAFKSCLTVIKAAGGLVCTHNKEVLLIYRKGKWDLPKGKLDEGEELSACAVREVQEETGLSGVDIVEPLTITYHTYHEAGKHILKESHWYLMRAERASDLTPQAEEDIEKCEWVPFDRLPAYLTNMHASIVDVIQKAEIFRKTG